MPMDAPYRIPNPQVAGANPAGNIWKIKYFCNWYGHRKDALASFLALM